jgi:hypothetical protein
MYKEVVELAEVVEKESNSSALVGGVVNDGGRPRSKADNSSLRPTYDLRLLKLSTTTSFTTMTIDSPDR